jgi:hypothetical protein
MNEKLRELFKMFYPLGGAERKKWADILSLPEGEYLSALEAEARKRGLEQSVQSGTAVWSDGRGEKLMLLFRIHDPGNLESVRRVYETISKSGAPLVYTFVHQTVDGEGTWDIFHMSKLTYLAHCNRVSGPGSEVDE